MVSYKPSPGECTPFQRSDVGLAPSNRANNMSHMDLSAVFHPLKDFAAIPDPFWDFCNSSISGPDLGECMSLQRSDVGTAPPSRANGIPALSSIAFGACKGFVPFSRLTKGFHAIFELREGLHVVFP
ncbi:hypothetical protein Taro_018590 [Colocasia esculenta]|uniref:Uncharacterized protein n=1 Tax=Colocasia esculenta TaxID=4460 RepID=A0A843V2W6_COLES|nr:hypothetical protein [Colocasia esculenta]